MDINAAKNLEKCCLPFFTDFSIVPNNYLSLILSNTISIKKRNFAYESVIQDGRSKFSTCYSHYNFSCDMNLFFKSLNKETNK